MIANYLKTAIRNLLRHKGYSFINLTGLAVGIACCILIMAYIIDEVSFDKFNANQENVYRLATIGKIGGRTVTIATVPIFYGPGLTDEYPEVLDYTRFRNFGKRVFTYGDRKFYEDEIFYVDNSVFNIFSFELLRGDPATALQLTNTIVINQEMAEKYFGEDDPVNKIIQIDSDQEFTVTGIIADPPSNSHIQFRALASFETLNPADRSRYNWNYQTYLLLANDTDYSRFEKNLVDYNERELGEFSRSFGAEFENYLQPLASIHLHSHIEGEIGNNGDIKYVYAFATIAIFILLVACINFMNLSTARSARRAREVGLRKVFGAHRKALVYQFLGESLLLSLLSTGLALVFVKLISPYFNTLAGRAIPIHLFSDPLIFGGLVVLILFIGLVAGYYPALFLSGFRSIRVLKGSYSTGAAKSKLRSGLVIFQFSISIILIIGTTVVHNQLHYMRSKNPGFNKEQVMVLPLGDDSMQKKIRLVKTEMSSIDGVLNAAGSMKVPGQENFNTSVFFPEGFNENESFLFENFNIDLDFLSTYQTRIVAGRNFSADFATDEDNAILINESAARALEWDEPVGKLIYVYTDDNDKNARKPYTVIGVIEDIHHRSLQHSIEPLLLGLNTENSRVVSLRLSGDDIPATIAHIEQCWNDLFPDKPFDYFFLDEYFDGLYRSEERLGNIFQTFTVLAILIGCLGLLGLASFAAEQRTKEIGIRKVLGASVGKVVLLLWREFLLLVLIANLFAWPVAWYLMHNWLQSFPYQTGLPLNIFLLAALAALVIAILTVSYQSIKAALANPVKSLRYE